MYPTRTHTRTRARAHAHTHENIPPSPAVLSHQRTEHQTTGGALPAAGGVDGSTSGNAESAEEHEDAGVRTCVHVSESVCVGVAGEVVDVAECRLGAMGEAAAPAMSGMGNEQRASGQEKRSEQASDGITRIRDMLDGSSRVPGVDPVVTLRDREEREEGEEGEEGDAGEEVKRVACPEFGSNDVDGDYVGIGGGGSSAGDGGGGGGRGGGADRLADVTGGRGGEGGDRSGDGGSGSGGGHLRYYSRIESMWHTAQEELEAAEGGAEETDMAVSFTLPSAPQFEAAEGGEESDHALAVALGGREGARRAAGAEVGSRVGRYCQGRVEGGGGGGEGGGGSGGEGGGVRELGAWVAGAQKTSGRLAARVANAWVSEQSTRMRGDGAILSSSPAGSALLSPSWSQSSSEGSQSNLLAAFAAVQSSFQSAMVPSPQMAMSDGMRSQGAAVPIEGNMRETRQLMRAALELRGQSLFHQPLLGVYLPSTRGDSHNDNTNITTYRKHGGGVAGSLRFVMHAATWILSYDEPVGVGHRHVEGDLGCTDGPPEGGGGVVAMWCAVKGGRVNAFPHTDWVETDGGQSWYYCVWVCVCVCVCVCFHTRVHKY